jgi:hypothetical protein
MIDRKAHSGKSLLSEPLQRGLLDTLRLIRGC